MIIILCASFSGTLPIQKKGFNFFIQIFLIVIFARHSFFSIMHQFSSVTQSCLTPTPGACWNSCPSSWWHHSAISPSVAPFSFCPQSFLASGSFPVSWLFTSCGQSKISSVARKYIKKWIPFFLFHYFQLSANINGMHVNNFITGKFIQRG